MEEIKKEKIYLPTQISLHISAINSDGLICFGYCAKAC